MLLGCVCGVRRGERPGVRADGWGMTGSERTGSGRQCVLSLGREKEGSEFCDPDFPLPPQPGWGHPEKDCLTVGARAGAAGGEEAREGGGQPGVEPGASGEAGRLPRWTRNRACLLGSPLQAREGRAASQRLGGPGQGSSAPQAPKADVVQVPGAPSRLPPGEELSVKAPTANQRWPRSADNAQGQAEMSRGSLPGPTGWPEAGRECRRTGGGLGEAP